MNKAVAQPLVLALALLAGGTGWNYKSFDRQARIKARYTASLVALPRPEVVRLLSLGFRHVLADWYWIKGVNYFGDGRNTAVAYAEFYNYLKLVTDLDPQYYPAYLFGGYALPWNRGDKWVNTQETAWLLEDGIKNFPAAWQLRFQLAYVYSAYLHRYKEAGDQLAAAARLPGSPPFLGTLATRMYATTGDLEGAELLAEHLMRDAEDPRVAALMRRRLMELRAANQGQALTQAAAKFAAAHGGHFPASLAELEQAGVAIPVEPLGGSWNYDPATGTVKSSVLKERLDIYIHPREAAQASATNSDARH
ncbi:MAG: hypothetical protein JST54_15825 [Deltaproteobacteria bacterium]|nr:hypothetical protein [Deltaproteobacteria bacterium]